jgi:DNA-binding transcriptional LysR family regulator
MRFESLQVFCDIARFRSFSQAAEANHLTQSAASQIVRQLEERLGVRLINRSTRPLQLTALGQVYYEGCRELVERYHQLEDRHRELEAVIRSPRTELTGTVRVAAIYSIGLGDMGQYVERFEGQHPQARVQVEYLHSNRVEERVRDGSADFGLVSFPRKKRELAVLPWREEPMVVVCPPGHPLAQQPAVRPSQLAGEKYVAFDRELGIRQEVDRFLREQDVSVEVMLEFDSIENIKKGIEVRGGVALLPEPTLRQELDAGLLVARPLEGCRFVRPLGIIHRRNQRLSPVALRFMEMLLADAAVGSHRPRSHGATRQPGLNGTARNGTR